MSKRLILIALFTLLAACGRPLSEGEVAFAKTFFGDEIDTGKVHATRFSAFDGITTTRPKRPRLACRERIWPEPETDTVKVGTAAFVLFDTIFISEAIYLDDYMPTYPKRVNLAAAMLFAHEMTHVWQWQNRERTGYHPLKAAGEHKPGTDPYLLEFTPDSRFLDFPFEQQGAIVEEYVCCRSLDPTGSRTIRLHKMLKDVLPLRPLETSLPHSELRIPWSGAKTRGICS